MKLMKMVLVFLLAIGIGAAIGADIDPVVQISNGKVAGKILNTVNGKRFYAFQGIPYAKPPLGDLRFQPPQRPDDWEGILDDRNANTICIQLTSTQLPNEKEDCLYLHVYTPQIPTEDLNVSLPVIYVIHGGAFVEGSALIGDMGPHFLLERDVIMVAVHYRLGFFGFLSTGDLAAPGNYGLKDQQFGLRWIQENIRSFGGDPTKVTIFGQSAGAASVSYQLLAPNSKGLFRSAIQDSGSALSIWSFQRFPRDIAFRIGNYIDNTIDEFNTTIQLVSFYRKLDVAQIKKACVDIFGEGLIAASSNVGKGYLLAVVVEPEHHGAFLTKTPYSLFESGDFRAVPTLMGINSEESIFSLLNENFQEELNEADEDPGMLTPIDMHIRDETINRTVGTAIKTLYVGEGQLHENIGPSIKLLSDSGFATPVLKQLQLQSKHSDVYLYEFAYSGMLGKMKFPFPDVEGADKVCHGEEMVYLFSSNSTVDLENYPEEDITTLWRTVTLWTNFVKYMNPTPEPMEILQNTIWPKITTTSKIPFLFINESLEVHYDLKKAVSEEYARLYSLYAVPPLDTY